MNIIVYEEVIIILYNILSCMILPILGIIFYTLGRYFKEGIKRSNICIYLLLCVILDEVIKVLLRYFININYRNISVNEYSIFMEQNCYGSSLGSILDKKFNYTFLILINILFLTFVILLYKSYIKKFGKSFWSDLFFIFTNAGLICSLIDKIFFGGSLDYINLHNTLLVDLKDIYLFLGIILLICEVILNENSDILLNKS